jgi:hypothetical protein
MNEEQRSFIRLVDNGSPDKVMGMAPSEMRRKQVGA